MEPTYAELAAEVERLRAIVKAYGLPLEVAAAQARHGPYFVKLPSVEYKADRAAYRNGHYLRWQKQPDGPRRATCIRCAAAGWITGDREEGYYCEGPILTTQCSGRWPRPVPDDEMPSERYAYTLEDDTD